MRKRIIKAVSFCLPAVFAVAVVLFCYSLIYPAEQVAYPTAASVSNEESELLARFVFAEAGDKSYIVKTSVAAVVFNRVKSGFFPKGICDVIYADSSFGSVKNGGIAGEADDAARSAVRDASCGVDPTDGALYFFASGEVPDGYNLLAEYEGLCFCN